MHHIYLQGLFLGMALILPIGPQNIMLINLSIQRSYSFLAATICFLSDLLLIYTGIFGSAASLNKFPKLLFTVTIFGTIFLIYYGVISFRKSWYNILWVNKNRTCNEKNWYNIILSTLAATWLNPQVYLDSILILGSLGSQLKLEERGWFAGGIVSASLLWFYGLIMITNHLSSWLIRPQIQRIIQLLVGLIMWILALKLIYQGWYIGLNIFN